MKPGINFFLPVRLRMKKIIPLCLAAAFALGAGEAAAQVSQVCTNPGIPALSIVPSVDPNEIVNPDYPTEDRVRELSGLVRQHGVTDSPHYSISCRYGAADLRNRGILVHNPQIVVVDDFIPGIEASHEGIGHLSIFVRAVSGEPGRAGEFQHHSPSDYGQGIFTTGNANDYLTGENSYGIYARHTGEGLVGIDVRNVSVRTTGDYSHGIYASQQGRFLLEGKTGIVWDEEQGFFVRDNSACPDCKSTRAKGGVVVNLIETDRDRDQRDRPLVETSGDAADAVRAEYTRAAAFGHIAVTVEGYTLSTGGIVPESALVTGVEPEKAIEVSIPRPPVYDPSKPAIKNPNYDSGDPNSPEFINIFLQEDGSLATDLLPYTAVYFPVRNPDYDPDDAGSSPWNSGIGLWNGRYFLALGKITEDYVNACQGESTADARRACYERQIEDNIGTNLPTGFNARGIYASHEGHGDIRIRATDSNIRTLGAEAQGIYAIHAGRTLTVSICTSSTPSECVGPDAPGTETDVTPGGGDISIGVTGSAISTVGEDSHGIWAVHRGDSGADDADRVTDPGDIGTGNVAIAIDGTNINTAGAHARGVFALIQQTCTVDTAEGCMEAANLVAGTGIGDIDIAVTGGSIATKGTGGAYAVQGRHENEGNIDVRMMGVTATTEGNEAHGVYGEHRGTTGNITLAVTDGGSVSTMGERAHGVYGEHRGTTGNITLAVTGGSVTTAGADAYGVRGLHTGTEGGLTFRMTGGSIETTGEHAYGVGVQRRDDEGDVTIDMTGGSVATKGANAHGLYAGHEAVYVVTEEGTEFRSGTGNLNIDAGGSVMTAGSGAYGVYGMHTGTGNLGIGVTVGGSVATAGEDAHGLSALHQGTGDITINVGGSVDTAGADAHGLSALHQGTGDVTIDVGGSVTTAGADAHGLYVQHQGTSTVTVDVGGSVTTAGAGAHGLYVQHQGMGTVTVDGSVTAMGAGSDGIRVVNEDGNVTVTVAQGARVMGGRYGVLVSSGVTAAAPTSTGGTGAGVRSNGPGVVGTGIAVPLAHGEDHFQLTNRGTITGGQAGVMMGANGQVENWGAITGEETGVMMGANGRVENRGAITGGQTGVMVGDNGEVENPGMIEGQVGIQAGADSTVVISGSVRSTSGPEGTAIRFTKKAERANTVTLRRGMNIVGDIRVYDQSDLVDASDLQADDLLLRIVDRNDNPLQNVRLPTQSAGCRTQGGTLLCLNTTAFALTDEVLSDLTGNIHAAVIGNGLSAHVSGGDPAKGRVWAAPFGGAREQNGVGGLTDGTHYFGGGMLGAGWGTVMRIGVFVGGSTGQLDVDNVQTIDMQTVFGGVYAQRALGDLLLDARFLMGSMNNDSTRRMGPNSAAVEYTSIFLSPEIGIATNVQLMSRLHATPRLQVRYAGLFTEGFRERGRNMLGQDTGWDLRYAKRDVQILEARGQVGIPIALENGGRIEPRVGLEGRYLLAGDTFDASLPTDGTFTSDAGGDRGVATGSLGLGLSLPVADATSLVGNFDGAFTTDDAWRATGYVGLVYSF